MGPFLSWLRHHWAPSPPSQASPWAPRPHPLFSARTQSEGGNVPGARPRLGILPRGWTRAGPAREMHSGAGTGGKDLGHQAERNRQGSLG